MKKFIRILSFAAFVFVLVAVTAFISESPLTANNSGAPSSRTGSPGDTKSCTTCHTGIAQTVSGLITSNVPATGYVPGSVYTISAECIDPSKTRFGFEISPQNTTGAKLGILSITDILRTQLIGAGKYITHTAAGTSGNGSNFWSFQWTAPPSGTGDVTFYGAFNFSNHNNASSGDVIKLSQLTLNEDLSTAIEENTDRSKVMLYPNPASGTVNIGLPFNTKILSVRIFDMKGNLVEEVVGDFTKGLDVTTFTAGTYYVYFATDQETTVTKLVKL